MQGSKICSAFLLSAIAAASHAASYYVSNSGNNNAAGTINAPWQTIAKVNQQNFPSGTQVYFQRGNRWEETLNVKTGVTYADYGTGNKPIISGAHSIASQSWSIYSGSIYVTNLTTLLSSLGASTISQLTFTSSGASSLMTPARYPNRGSGDYGSNSIYLKIGADNPNNGTDSLQPRSGAIPVGKDVVGATLHVKNNNYIRADFTVGTGSTYDHLIGLTPQRLDPQYPSVENTYAFKAGMGFWLEGKLWMLDAPGEWYFDPSTKLLYVWMSSGTSPVGQDLAITYKQNGIVAEGATDFTVSNIEVDNTVGDAVHVHSAARANLNGISSKFAGNKGIAITNSNSMTIDSANISASYRQGIWMGDIRYPETQPSTGLTVSNSTVNYIGLVNSGYYAHSGIELTAYATATNNTVLFAPYIGISGTQNATINGNYVGAACYRFDDCGGINLTSSVDNQATVLTLNANISNNIVNGLWGSPDGNPGPGTMTVGIYLDGFANSVTLNNNLAMDADYGYLLNLARNITVDGNYSFDNHVSEVIIQEPQQNGVPNPLNCAVNPVFASGCSTHDYAQNNTFTNNVFVSTGYTPIITQGSGFGNTSDFASFSNNKYLTVAEQHLVQDVYGGSPVISKTLAQWQTDNGKDTGSTVRVMGKQLTVLSGTPAIPKFDFETVGSEWSGGYGGGISRVPCATGYCMQIQPQSYAPVLDNGKKNVALFTTSTGYTLYAGRTYMLSFDAKATTASKVDVTSVIRVPAGTGQADVSNYGSASLTTTWQRVTRVLTPNTDTSSAILALNLSMDMADTAFIDNITLVEVQANGSADNVFVLYNSTATATTASCPAANQSLCSSYVDLKTGLAVPWPSSSLPLNAHQTKIVVLQNSPWLDTDLDGTPNNYDLCANTPPEQGANEKGCGYFQ